MNKRIATLFFVFLAACSSLGQSLSVAAKIEVYVDHKLQDKDNSNVLVWLEPIGETRTKEAPLSRSVPRKFVIMQKDREFVPHVLIVPVGVNIEFPNHDSVFHNAFSLFDGERFDLGLYEAGQSKVARFDRPGVSYIFCNIHYEMSAIVIALDTPYYGLSDRAGTLRLTDVPPGNYRLRLWAEGASVQALESLSREIYVDHDLFLGTLAIETMPALKIRHYNKYGLPYDRPSTDSNPYAVLGGP